MYIVTSFKCKDSIYNLELGTYKYASLCDENKKN